MEVDIEGLVKAKHVIKRARGRVRISFLDAYDHVQEEKPLSILEVQDVDARILGVEVEDTKKGQRPACS